MSSTELTQALGKRRGARGGWARIELIVAAVFIVTALGLLLVVLLQSRGLAERMECASHLQRIGGAIQAFHDKNHTLPASCIAPGYATWAVEIAPFLERSEGKGLAAWDLGLPFYDQPAVVREAAVPVYYCPARRKPGELSKSGDVPLAVPGQLANYAGALGDYGCAPTSDNFAMPWTSAEADGAIIVGDVLEKKGDRIVRWQARTALADLKRGQASTILLGEKHVQQGDFGQCPLGDGSLYNGDYPASFARLVDIGRPLAKGPTDSYNLNFGSWHPGICQFLMADGHLHVAGDEESPKLLQSLIPRRLAE